MGVFHPHHSDSALWGYRVLAINCSGSVTNTAYCILFDIYIVALATGNPSTKVPYDSITDTDVLGFPNQLKFGPPPSFNCQDLKLILDKSDEISMSHIQYYQFSLAG